MERNEVHVMNAENGHLNSTDCWCEPSAVQWVKNKHGVNVLVVEHNDNTLMHYRTLLACRERDKLFVSPTSVHWGIDAPWITRTLDAVPIPPDSKQDPNERNL
jgi:hypothetical protein